MDETTQTIVALLLVAVALGFLVWRGLWRRRGGCAGEGCGCGRALSAKSRKQKTGD